MIYQQNKLNQLLITLQMLFRKAEGLSCPYTLTGCIMGEQATVTVTYVTYMPLPLRVLREEMAELRDFMSAIQMADRQVITWSKILNRQFLEDP
jgi:hypothetical protein